MESLLAIIFFCAALIICCIMMVGGVILALLHCLYSWVSSTEQIAEEEYGREQVKKVKKVLGVDDR